MASCDTRQAVIGVTGATGGVGGRVAARLTQRGVPQRLVVRDPGRAPSLAGAEVVQASSYGDFDAMRAALEAVPTLFLVSAGEDPHRVQLHRTAVDAAVAAGVRRLVYLSFLAAAPNATFTFARDHFFTEEHIRSTGLPFTFLRSSIYLDFLPFLCSAEGVIRGPAGTGRVAPASRDDIADVATAVLTGKGHDGRTYDMTGPEAVTMAGVAGELTRVTGRPISYLEETLEEARASRVPTGAPAWEIEGWVTTYAAIASGELDVVSDTVEKVAGHRPESIPEFFSRHPESYIHLLSE